MLGPADRAQTESGDNPNKNSALEGFVTGAVLTQACKCRSNVRWLAHSNKRLLTIDHTVFLGAEVTLLSVTSGCDIHHHGSFGLIAHVSSYHLFIDVCWC